MQSSITLPQLRDDLVDATVVRWLKSPSEGFSAGDLLVELEIEDALVHLEASQAGKLTRLVAQPRQTVRVGEVLAEIATSGEASGGSTPAAEKSPARPAAPAKKESPAKSAPSAVAGSPENVRPILMPQASNTMEEGILVAWKVSEGDTIEVGQVICELETDKATVEYESPEAGRIARFLLQENEAAAIKEPIALLADRDADVEAYLAGRGTAAAGGAASESGSVSPSVSAASASAGVSTSAAVSAPVARTAGGRIKASPAARKLAAARGLDLATLGQGSGPGGRILSGDLARAKQAAPAADGQPRRYPMPKMRRAIGLNLQRSKQTVPHFYLSATVNAAALVDYYRARKPHTGCTINDCIVLATGRTMAEFPAVRSQIVENEIVEFPHANIGIAVGVEHGLVVPVVRNVDTLSLDQLANEAKRVVEHARNGKLDNVGHGNFTITNLGMFGVEQFSAIINPPESGILAVGAAREAVIVEDGAIRTGRVMTLTISTDHRIVDGVVAAKFIGRLKEFLEHPDDLLG